MLQRTVFQDGVVSPLQKNFNSRLEDFQGAKVIVMQMD